MEGRRLYESGKKLYPFWSVCMCVCVCECVWGIGVCFVCVVYAHTLYTPDDCHSNLGLVRRSQTGDFKEGDLGGGEELDIHYVTAGEELDRLVRCSELTPLLDWAHGLMRNDRSHNWDFFKRRRRHQKQSIISFFYSKLSNVFTQLVRCSVVMQGQFWRYYPKLTHFYLWLLFFLFEVMKFISRNWRYGQNWALEVNLAWK